MKHFLIYGPAACGKTLNSALLARHFGCENIEDGVLIGEFKHLAANALKTTVYLTNEVPDAGDAANARRAEVLSFGEAMHRAGVAPYGSWVPGVTLPTIPRATELPVRMRGRVDGAGPFVEVSGFYLNEYGLYYDDGCECFAEGENEHERKQHDDLGCPHSGFYYVDPDGGEEAVYQRFEAASWCKR